jgi:preprotein translocase subunit SecA
VEQHVLPRIDFTKKTLKGLTTEAMKDFLKERTHRLYEERETELGSETMRELEKSHNA